MISQSDIIKQREENMLQINLASALKRLYSNPDFVTVFKKYYGECYVLELVSNLALYDNKSVEYKETIKELNVISSFKKFLDTILTNGAMAENDLKELTAIGESEINYE